MRMPIRGERLPDAQASDGPTVKRRTIRRPTVAEERR
jgi:hypothetical protein